MSVALLLNEPCQLLLFGVPAVGCHPAANYSESGKRILSSHSRFIAFVVSVFATPGVDILLRHGVDEDLVVLGPRGVALELPGNVEAHGLLHPVEAGAGNRHYLGADWHRHWHP